MSSQGNDMNGYVVAASSSNQAMAHVPQSTKRIKVEAENRELQKQLKQLQAVRQGLEEVVFLMGAEG